MQSKIKLKPDLSGKTRVLKRPGIDLVVPHLAYDEIHSFENTVSLGHTYSYPRSPYILHPMLNFLAILDSPLVILIDHFL